MLSKNELLKKAVDNNLYIEKRKRAIQVLTPDYSDGKIIWGISDEDVHDLNDYTIDIDPDLYRDKDRLSRVEYEYPFTVKHGACCFEGLTETKFYEILRILFD